MELKRIVNQPVIETSRFDLRPPRRSDAGLIDMYAADERIAKMTTTIPHPLPPGVTEAFVARAMADERQEDLWVMDGITSQKTEVMGVISLKRLDRDQAEIVYWVAPQFWNTGLASEAVQALMESNPLDNDTIFASVFQDNPASARVLTHCGFEYLGDAENYSVARGSIVSTWTYSRKMARQASN